MVFIFLAIVDVIFGTSGRLGKKVHWAGASVLHVKV